MPRSSFLKFFMIAGLSLSLASPARAGDDAAKVLAGLLGVALLGAAIHHITDDDGKTVHVVTPPPQKPHAHPPKVKPRPLPDQVRHYTLPRHCVRSKGHTHGSDALLAKRCLKQHVAYPQKLPKTCEVQYWNKQKAKLRKGYTLHCLKHHGYRLARR